MKKLNVWQWIGIALIVLAIVGCIVMTYKAPLAAIMLVVGFVGGMATMWLLKKHNIVNSKGYTHEDIVDKYGM